MVDPPFDAFRYAHEHRREIVWMSQNTNHLVPPGPIQQALQQAIEERRYEGYPPAQGLPELHTAARSDLGLSDRFSTLVTGGGTETLYMLTRALLGPGDEVVASDPSYLIIHKFIELCGARTRDLPIYSPPYRLSSDRVAQAIGPKTRMILLIDPLNPLGSGCPKDEVRAIAELAHDHRLWLLNDVTYRDFADAHTLAASIAPEETLTVWSVSKNCGLAGLRLGGLAALPGLCARIGKYNTNDLGVNILAQVAALAGLRTKAGWFSGVKATTRSNQGKIRKAVEATTGTFLPVYPSQANMFLVDTSATGVTPEAIQKELLLRYSVFVRAGNYLSPSFGGRFVRVSFSNPASEIQRFVDSFPAVVEKLRRPASTPSRVPTPARS